MGEESEMTDAQAKDIKEFLMMMRTEIEDKFNTVYDWMEQNHKTMEQRFDKLESEIQSLRYYSELLTKQTSNAVVEHQGGQLDFVKHKIYELERELYQLKADSDV